MIIRFKRTKKKHPYILIVSSALMKLSKFNGKAFGPIVIIDDSKNDKIVRHEEIHVDQFYRNPIKYCIVTSLYNFKLVPQKLRDRWIKEYIDFELEAYIFSEKNPDIYDRYTSAKYHLAKKLINKYGIPESYYYYIISRINNIDKTKKGID